MAEIKVTKQNFEEVINGDKVAIIDFYANWCAPCKMLAPTLSEIANENNDVVVGKINVDEEMELAEKFQVFSIPTLIVFKGGEVVNKSVGLQSKQAILSLIKV